MDQDVIKMFKTKNKEILINTLKYDIEKNMTSLFDTITNIFNHEFDTAIKNIVSIYEDSGCQKNQRFITDTINQMKMDSYRELEKALDFKKNQLEDAIGSLEFDESEVKQYYHFVLDTTLQLKKSVSQNSIVAVQKDALALFQKNIRKNIEFEKSDLAITRIQEYLMNRLYGKLETKIHMEIMLRDNNLINKAKEGYERYQEICAKTEEKA